MVAHTNSNRLCKSCSTLDEAEEVSNDLSNNERECLITKIRTANRFHLRVLTEIPKSLRRLWSDCVAATLMKFAKAKTDDDLFRALESWVKLKSVLILPVKVNKRSSSRNLHQEQMLNWIAGNEEDCWRRAAGVEQERQKSSKRRYVKPKISKARGWNVEQNDTLTNTQMKMYKRAKKLLNMGQVSKAMSTILSNGVAKVDSEVLSQLRAKHPPPYFRSASI